MPKDRENDNDFIEEDVPFDGGAFESDKEEFLDDSDYIVDDNQTDYYEYGDKMHSVRADIPPTPGKHGRHSRPATRQQHMDAHQRRSRRTRWILRFVALLLIGCLAALGYFGWQLFQESRDAAIQQSNQAAPEANQAADNEEVAHETTTATVSKTEPFNLLGLMGLKQDEAVKAIGHGATVTLDSDVDEKDNPVKKKQNVVLADEPSDTKSGTPTVYLGEDKDGKVIQVGYSAPTASLGYGSLSFSDAIETEHVVEQTLRSLGLVVEDGTVKLPQKDKYATYADDGTTLVKENASFEGTCKGDDGNNYAWTAVLHYNYTAANASGNLADTVRTIFIYIDKK